MMQLLTKTTVFYLLCISVNINKCACVEKVPDMEFYDSNIFNENVFNETTTNFTEFVVNGQRASIGNYPWFAQVSINQNGYLHDICGGTLIDKNWVLTAAHCVHEAKYTVEIGRYSDNSDSGVKYRDVNYACQHKQFNTQTFSNDIALFRLNAPVKNIDTVSYGSLTSFYANMPFKVIGFGATDAMNNNYPTSLLEGDVFYVSNQYCGQKWQTYIDSSKVCTAGYGMQDACLGDSGGPLLKKTNNGWEQVGVVSFGANPCNNAEYPVMHTNVYNYNSWIRNVIDGDYSQCA